MLPKQMGFTIRASAACRLVHYAIPNLDPSRLRWATVITYTVRVVCAYLLIRVLASIRIRVLSHRTSLWIIVS